MTAARRKKPAAPPKPEFPRVVETFQKPHATDMREQTEPSCFNGFVRIRRYRITVELIEEPIEVLRERLLKLWRESERNTHHTYSMREAAKELGMDPEELKHSEHGIDYKDADKDAE
jgi:hypothetical protein